MPNEPELLWKLYDAEQKIFFNDLDLLQLQAMINTIKKNELDHWHVSKDGGEDWFPLKVLLTEIEKKSAKKPSANVEILEIVGFDTFVKTVTGFQSTKAVAEQAPSRIIEKRKMRRTFKRVKVLIDAGEKILEAYTKDISILGIKIDQKFPLSYSGRTYPVVLRSKPPVELRCVPFVSETDHMKGYWNRLKIHPSFNLNALVALLEK